MIPPIFPAMLASLVAATPASLPATGLTPAPAASAPARPPDDPADIVIVNSGSTNTPGYRIAIHPDASVDVRSNGTTVRKALDPALAAELRAKIASDGPLSALVSGHCMRSASFGSFTTLSYGGQTTGDLGCGASPMGADLGATVREIVAKLGAGALTGFRRRPL